MNYHRIKATFLFRAGYGVRYGLKLAGALVTALATALGILQATGRTCEIQLIGELLVLILLISLLGASIKSRVNHLPDTIIIDDDQDGRYVLGYETKDICQRFNRETVKYFGRDCIDDILVEKWRTKIPEAFIYLKNQKNEPCAALCVFGMEASFMKQFVKGRLSECDIGEEDVLDLANSKKSDSLYVPAILVDHPHTPVGHRRALVMLWGTIQYLKRVYGVSKERNIFAVPVNRASENLLNGLGFQKVAEAFSRKEKHPLYCLTWNRGVFTSILERIGDYSRMCTITI